MWQFLKEYLSTPDTIGAIAPSSRHLAVSMTAFIDFDKADCIVEYGAGTGVFTRDVAARKRPDTTYIVIEQNDRFYEILRKQFHGMPGVVLIHGDAGNVCSYLREQGFRHADYIISGLPFTSLPQQVSHRILTQTQKAIGMEGVFTTFQYTLLRNKGQVLTMAQIYEAVWHEEFFCSENAVMMHIANLRNKLNWDNVHSDFIKTCWGRGYQI